MGDCPSSPPSSLLPSPRLGVTSTAQRYGLAFVRSQPPGTHPVPHWPPGSGIHIGLATVCATVHPCVPSTPHPVGCVVSPQPPNGHGPTVVRASTSTRRRSGIGRTARPRDGTAAAPRARGQPPTRRAAAAAAAAAARRRRIAARRPLRPWVAAIRPRHGARASRAAPVPAAAGPARGRRARATAGATAADARRGAARRWPAAGQRRRRQRRRR